MRTVDILAFCCYILCMLITCSGKRGFILTAPKLIDAGSTEYLTLTVFDVPHGGDVTVKLMHRQSGFVLSESNVSVINNINMWVEITVPHLSSDVDAKLQILGTFRDGYRIDETKDIRIRHKTLVTLIQTDKPLYKPGQAVKFRILPMDSQLKPLGSDTVGDIWIEDPSNIRVAQWRSFKFDKGMIQLELPLSEEPTFGTWSIKSLINQVTAVQTFRVEKYVLPKFELLLKIPDYIMADAKAISTTVCAQYTYGKRVDGTLRARFTYEKRHYENAKKLPSVEYLVPISGCYEFVVSAEEIHLDNATFGYRTVDIFAEVTENLTGIVRNASAKIGITHSPLHMEFTSSESRSDYFKPGIPFYGKLQVRKPDGSPAVSEKIEICARTISRQHSHPYQKHCHAFNSNENGTIQFSVSPKSKNVSRVEIEAEAINYQTISYDDRWTQKIIRPRADLVLNPWHSPSGSFLQIEPVTEEMQCEKLQRVKISFTAKKGSTIKFYHQVLSRGRIVQQGSHQRTFFPTEDDERSYDLGNEPPPSKDAEENELGEFILSFDPRATMSPIARLLVFYVRDDGEVVADSRVFRIAQCLVNKVSLHFRHEQQYPSTDASMLLSASASSVCGIGLVDKSVRLLKKDSQFDKNKLFKLMETYDVGRNDHPRQVREDYCFQKQNPDVHEHTEAMPPQPYVLSRSFSSYVDSTLAFDEAGMVIITDMTLETRPCEWTYPEAVPYRGSLDGPHGVFLLNRMPSRVDIRARSNHPKRKSSSDSDKLNPPKSVEEIRTYFPETWLWEIQTVGESGEMALSRKLPHTITEWTGEAVCVHSKTGLGISDPSSIRAFQPFFISFQLPYSVVRGEVLPLVVSVFNYLSECLPIKLSLEPSEDYKILSESRYNKTCVCGDQGASNRFLLKPVTMGKVNITVYGFSLEDDDVCRDEITARLIARDAVTKTLLVEAEGFPKEEVYNYYICPENTNGSYVAEVDLLLPENVIPDSARAYVSVTGDLMGPALNGLAKLVRQPVGCGEQNMILFVPNIFVMDYLTATGKITDDVRENCIKYMKTGYQRELQYRHVDGSYSAFGPSDSEGSLWLTSFVVRSFGQAKRFVDIDIHDLMLSTNWILTRQFENGCFEPSGKVLHKAMKGGLSDNEESLAPLTAYVLISLLESDVNLPHQGIVKNAMKCLEAETTINTYGLALFAYASALAGQAAKANSYLELLEEKSTRRGNQVFWESPKSKSVSVEIAGYYILSLVHLEAEKSTARVLPVVMWLTRQRNSNGGFVSTQDTVVALQALAKYSTMQSQKLTDMGIVVESDELVRGFKLDESNKLLTQSVKIPVLPTVVEQQAVGEGCAFLQYILRYNVEMMSGSDAFDLSLDVMRLGSSECNLPRIAICMRYKPLEQVSNMVVLSVKMVSGFLPDEWSLYRLQSDEVVKLKRHEVDGNQVNLYFDELTNDQKCFHFFIKSEIEVEDLQPGIIKLYDYYQPELEVIKEYVIPTNCTAASLPDLPRLPPLVFDEGESFQSETELPSTLTTLQVQDSDDLNVPTATNTDSATLSSDTIAESESKMELADEAEHFNQHLDNFFDTTADLDFPDGIEGNLPVSVSLPEDFTPAMENDSPMSPDCPICEDQFPDNLTDIYCNAAFALRMVMRDENTGMVKILQDISSYLTQPQAVKKFARLEYDSMCSCLQLKERGKILFLIGEETILWNSENEKHQIQLTSKVHVISSPSKAVQPIQLKEAKDLCHNDP